MTADLSALIARLEAAEEVTHALEVEFATFMYANGATFASVVNYDPELWSERNASPLSSFDAALALAERALGEWFWQFDIQPGRSWAQGAPEAWPEGLVASDRGGVYCSASTLPLALCIAILKTKQESKP